MNNDILQSKLEGWENVKPLEPMPIKTQPYKHQIFGYNLGLQMPNIALLMEMRTGKTLTAISIMGARFRRGEIRRVLIVCPASVIPVWQEQIDAHSDFSVFSFALQGLVAKKVDLITNLQYLGQIRDDALQVVIVNYESLWRMIPQDQRGAFQVNRSCFMQWQPDMIICDESQRIKTTSTRQSRALHLLGRLAQYRMILTGTPVTQNPLDFYSQYKFLDPTIFGKTYYSFRARYAIMGGYQGYQVVGYQNLPELIQKVHSIAFRCTKEECLDLPAAIDQELYCDLEPSAFKTYKKLAKASVAELENGNVLTAPNVLARLLRLSQLTGGFLVAGDQEEKIVNVSKAKLNLLRETLEDLIEAGKKVVIFARFIPEIEAIKKLLYDMKIDFQCITGEVPVPVRGLACEQFRTKDHIRVFVSQIQVGGVGIDLSSADTTIFYSLDFNFANYDQCRARTVHPEKQNHCAYIHLIANKTTDIKIMKALREKRNIADECVNNWRNYLEVE